MEGSDIVEDVEHEGAVTGPHFIDYEVLIGGVGDFVVRDEVAGNSFAIVGAE